MAPEKGLNDPCPVVVDKMATMKMDAKYDESAPQSAKSLRCQSDQTVRYQFDSQQRGRPPGCRKNGGIPGCSRPRPPRRRKRESVSGDLQLLSLLGSTPASVVFVLLSSAFTFLRHGCMFSQHPNITIIQNLLTEPVLFPFYGFFATQPNFYP